LAKKKKRTKSDGGAHIKVTAQNKIARIEKEITRLEDKPTATRAVEALRTRVAY